MYFALIKIVFRIRKVQSSLNESGRRGLMNDVIEKAMTSNLAPLLNLPIEMIFPE